VAQPDVPPINLEYAFSMRIENSGRIQFEGQMRSRVFEPATGGEIWGPKLQGRIVPQSGADYASNNMMNAHMMLQMSDGTWVYMNLLGYEHTATDDGSLYFRVSPYFDAPAGTFEWLAKTVFIGTGERHNNPGEMVLHFYELL
jgi:hypothetical protein